MLVSLRLELLKVMRKSRTYIGPAALSLLIIAMLVGMKHGHEFQYMRRRLEQDFIVAGSFVNAAFLVRFLLEGITYTFLPLFACMVCGDLLASEAADGTLRTLLCRPVTRMRVAISKYAVAIMYVLGLTFGTGLFAYLMGWGYLGRGSLVVLQRGVWIYPEHDAILKLLAAYALVACGMVALGSIAFAISTFLSNSNGAIAAAMGLLYGSAVIGEIQYFAKIKPYLLTTQLEMWRDFFTGVPDAHALTKAVGIMAAYSAISLIVGLVIFNRRDVLS